MRLPQKSKVIHIVFDVGLIAKAVDGILEVFGGTLLLILDPSQIRGIARMFTQGELNEDPDDFIANHLLRASQQVSRGEKLFATIFLLGHGAVKLGLVWALLRKHSWAYPTAIVAFAVFVAYQFDRYARTHSASLLLLSILDIFMIVITYLEYERVRRARK